MQINQKLVIGISGTIASGKNIVADILKAKGFHAISLSSIVRDELAKKGFEPGRKSMQDEGNSMRKALGGEVLARRALEKFKSYDSPLIIDGIRNMIEVDFLRANSRFFLIGVDAPFETRWERVKARNRDSDLLNHDRFVIDDARDRGFNEPLDGQQVAMCLVHADFLIVNDEELNGPVENSKLYRDVIEIYRQIVKK